MSIIHDYLAARAIPPDIAAERGYRHVYTGKADGSGSFAADFGFPVKASGLLIPLHGVDESRESFQLRQWGDGPKFVNPKGQPPCVATHPRTREDALRGEGELWIVEGVTRVDALTALGITAVGIQGISAWRSKGAPLQQWDDVRLRGRNVVVAPDGDYQSHENVTKSTNALLGFLFRRGVERAVVISVPDDLGLDDFIAAGGNPTDLPRVEKAATDSRRVFERKAAAAAGNDHEAVAIRSYQDKTLQGQTGVAYRLLLRIGERIAFLALSHEGNHSPHILTAPGLWSADQADWHSMIHAMLVEDGRKLGEALDVAGVKDAARWREYEHANAVRSSAWAAYERLRHEGIDPGCRVVQPEEIETPGYLPCGNGVVRLADKALLPYDSPEATACFFTRRTETHYRPEMADRWKECAPIAALHKQLGADGLRAAFTLAGLAAHAHNPDTIPILLGPPRTGKGLFVALVAAALGALAGSIKNAAAVSGAAQSASHNDSDGGMFKFRFGYVDEAAQIPPQRKSTVLGRLKDWTGGLIQTFSPKGQRGYEARVTVTPFLLCNEKDLDRLGFNAEGAAERTRIIAFRPLACPQCGERVGVGDDGITTPAHGECGTVRVVDEALRIAATTQETREHVLSLMVRFAPPLPAKPLATEEHLALVENLRASERSEIEAWAHENYEKTGQHRHAVIVKAVWTDWRVFCAEESWDAKEHGGYTKSQFIAAFRAQFRPLAAATKVSGNDRGWQGIRRVGTPEQGEL